VSAMAATRFADCRRGLLTTVKIEGARQAHFQHLPNKALAHFL
jgi:hypothetical protein